MMITSGSPIAFSKAFPIVKGLVKGFGEKVDGFGRTIAKVEQSVGNAITAGAKAIGISEQALATTGRLARKVLQIFNVVSTLAVLVEQLFTLRVLGGRIDAVEAGLIRLGNDVSNILGRILALYLTAALQLAKKTKA